MKYTTKALATLSLILASFTGAIAQGPICLGTDATICSGDQITIDDCLNLGAGSSGVPYTLAQIPYNPDPFGTNFVNLFDDQYSPAINIGFDFCFYGATHTQLTISSNNLVSFDLANAGGYSAWTTSAIADPTSTTTFNSIMCPWQDINPGLGGNITYDTYGIAPNRRFVVTWDNVPMFSCTGVMYTSQIKIFETTNKIETHILNKAICGTWNSGNAVHGVHAPLGLDALTVPGRNNTQWSVSNEGYEFNPEPSIQWEDTQGNNFPYNAGSLTVTPLPIPPSDSVGYFLVSTDHCGVGVNISDTSWITVSIPVVTASAVDDICSSSIGEVSATPVGGIAPFTFNWPTLGNNPNPTVTGVPAGTYLVQMTDAAGCLTTAQATVGDTPAAFQGSMTIISCPGGNDGTAFAEMIPMLGNITYQWDDPLLQTTQTAVGLIAGQYNCTITSDVGCSGVVTLDVLEIPGMIANIVNQTDVTCNSGNDGMIDINVVQGTPPYSYSWDNSSSTTNIATDLLVGAHSIDITDANGCMINIQGLLGEPAALNITFITADTQICPEDDIQLQVTGAGGSSPYTFTWSESGTVIGTGDQITVDPTVTNTTYCVVLSEACGSPTDDECTLIYFPTPIVPSAIPDEVEKCVPGYYEFTNTSTNSGEIATTYWDLGSLEHSILEPGNDSISLWFDQVGTYTLNMTITSVYGCVYEDSIPSIIVVKPTPTADFFFSTNPATIFETAVFMQDKSSFDVIAWDWYSPGSSPTTSSSENPSFQFPEGVVGEYPITLAVVTERGCVDTITYIFHVIPDVLFFAPNTFTPDGDEFNQYWKPEISGIDIYDYDLFIFNRWGELIWENHDPSVGWDGTYKGKPIQDGTYAWRARVTNLYDDGKEEFSGSINLIR